MVEGFLRSCLDLTPSKRIQELQSTFTKRCQMSRRIITVGKPRGRSEARPTPADQDERRVSFQDSLRITFSNSSGGESDRQRAITPGTVSTAQEASRTRLSHRLSSVGGRGGPSGKPKSGSQAHRPHRNNSPYDREHRSVRGRSDRTRDQSRAPRDSQDRDCGGFLSARGQPAYDSRELARHCKHPRGQEDNRRRTLVEVDSDNGPRKRRRLDDREEHIGAATTSTCQTLSSAQVKAAEQSFWNHTEKLAGMIQVRTPQYMALARPPQDFRQVSIAPSGEDFRRYAKPFLRPNVVQGRYDDVQHYLDVQFRLLREDYLIPLREGVEQLRRERTPSAQRWEGRQDKPMRIYHDITVLNPVFSTKSMVYRVRFDHQHRTLRNVPWHKSSRLKFGSLVCLSSDDFQTLFFASVENREAKDLRHGQLDIRFENVQPEEVNRFISKREAFKMVESSAYFEAYRHNLEALQGITEDAFPFKEHIIHCQNEISPPEYLTETSTFDLSVIKPKDQKIEKDEEHGGPMEEDELEEGDIADSSSVQLLAESWPAAETLGLNTSQLRAFQLALTKRFALIQGPPGTGKTYVGLKIAQTLLHNAKTWQGEDGPEPPILMISYTNHALDQFLRGLYNSVKGIYSF